ncbi:MAG TPA: hypothetical protein VI997_05670 [Candidatus Thermoplasmatota archaeon]|nr:hypothetical protein [Candidatus Thermoplasmatota archaeon]
MRTRKEAKREPGVAFRGRPGDTDWVADAIRYYRAAGFFPVHESDAAAEAYVREALRSEYGRTEELSGTEDPEATLLGLDPDRVWAEDLEQDVMKGNGMYEAIVRKFAAISCGLLDVDAIAEVWETEDGPVHVRAVVNGEKRTFDARGMGDWYDFDAVLAAFDSWIAGTGHRYRSAVAPGQDGIAIVLTDAEAARLSADRSWDFFE